MNTGSVQWQSMRLAHLTGAAAIFITGLLWAQIFPDLDNQVPEIRVSEMLQSGNSLKVAVQNISSKTIRGLSLVLGKHRVDKDWSGLSGGGLPPNANATLTISMAGLAVGGTRHHPALPGKLQVLDARFADVGGGPVVPGTATPVPVVTKVPERTVEPVRPLETTTLAVRQVEVKAAVPQPEPKAEPVPTSEPKLLPRPVEPAVLQVRTPVVDTAPPPKPMTAPVPTPAPVEEAKMPQPPSAPPRPTGQSGTREQGSKGELARLVSLIEPLEPELAAGYPRTALRKMIALVVRQQNAWASQTPITPFDQGQLNALQSFAFGLQTIQDRRDLEDDTLREQVTRFLKNQRRTLAKP